MAEKITIVFAGENGSTDVPGLGEFQAGESRTFSGDQVDLAKNLAETNKNFTVETKAKRKDEDQ